MILPILYEDSDIIAIDKPAKLLVHRTKMDFSETESVVQYLRDQIDASVFPVHRLDKPTSGILVMAKSSEAARLMGVEFAERRIHKQYIALVRGFLESNVTIDYPLKEELDRIADKNSKKDKPPQSALTHVKLIDKIELPLAVDKYPTARYSLVRAIPITGRKHQIRRHLRHINHPIVGDVNYGTSKHNRFFETHFQSKRLLLACNEISFLHPRTKINIQIKAPLAKEFTSVLQQLGFSNYGVMQDILL